jgi:3-oxoacyl-[acyl-carrier-protein] synthase-3
VTSIADIACALPDGELTNADLAREHPEWGMDALAEVSGVRTRRVAARDETAFDLSMRACEDLFARPGNALADVDAILYCTQDPDYRVPGNAHLLHARLGVGDEVFALDYNLACSGFVYGLALADGLVSAGTASRVLLVTAETQSKRMHPGDRSVRVLLGDGAAATLVTAEDRGGRLAGAALRTHGRGLEHGYVPAGGARLPASAETRRETVDRSGNVRTAEDMHMDGTELWAFVNSAVPRHVRSFLGERSLSLDDFDLVVLHPGSKLILDSLTKALALPREKVFARIAETGNLGSASIPFALRAALDEGAIEAGDRVLLVAYGVGVSYGSAILEFGA